MAGILFRLIAFIGRLLLRAGDLEVWTQRAEALLDAFVHAVHLSRANTGETLGEGVQNQPITATDNLAAAVREAERGRVVIVVLRKMNETLRFADRVFALSNVHILRNGTKTVIDAGLIEALVRAKVKKHSKAAGSGFIEPD